MLTELWKTTKKKFLNRFEFFKIFVFKRLNLIKLKMRIICLTILALLLVESSLAIKSSKLFAKSLSKQGGFDQTVEEEEPFLVETPHVRYRRRGPRPNRERDEPAEPSTTDEPTPTTTEEPTPTTTEEPTTTTTAEPAEDSEPETRGRRRRSRPRRRRRRRRRRRNSPRNRRRRRRRRRNRPRSL